MTLYLLLSLVSANSAFSAAVLRYNGVQQAPKKMLCFIAESSVFCRKIIYNDTIKNNIVFHREVSDDEFQEVVHLTCVEEIVKTMFLGYDTRLEENGSNLSGGQRQRIILARMLLKPSQIILIDEGLNAMDVNLERKILKNLFCKYHDKTIIIVSHRMENLDLFDHFIKFSSGHIVEDVRKAKGCSL